MEAPLAVTLTGSDNADTGLAGRVREMLPGVLTILNGVAGEWSVPEITIEVRVVDDLAAAAASIPLPDDPAFLASPPVAERLGGTILGKTLTLDVNYQRQVVLIAERSYASDASVEAAWTAFFLAHELTHAITGRVRAASGARQDIRLPTSLPKAVARMHARGAIDEVRCDLMADVVLARMVSVTGPDGASEPLRFGRLTGGLYAARLSDVLEDHVHPGWPDTVQAYRTHELSLEEMFNRIATEYDEVLTLTAHAHAEMVSLGERSPFAWWARRRPWRAAVPRPTLAARHAGCGG